LNQGILAAISDPEVTHIGMLHSDDKLNSAEFERYLAIVEDNPAEVFYSDIEFHNPSGQTVRKWNAGEYSRFKLNTGWMPPHTSIIVASKVYQRLGLYDPSFGTAADYEWIVRVMTELGEDSNYFPERTVTMLVGGASSVSLAARLRANAMDARVWAGRSWLHRVLIRLFKPLRKLGQFVFIERR
jgi:glycosyltransferase